MTQQTVSYAWTVDAHDIPPAYYSKGTVLWKQSTGWQEFRLFESNQATNLLLRRDRDWWLSPPGWVWGLFPAQSGDPGGGGPG